jgi:hypothetical protein
MAGRMISPATSAISGTLPGRMSGKFFKRTNFVGNAAPATIKKRCQVQ